MDEGPFREVNFCPANQKLLRILWDRDFHLNFHRGHTCLYPEPDGFGSFHLFNITFNIIPT